MGLVFLFEPLWQLRRYHGVYQFIYLLIGFTITPFLYLSIYLYTTDQILSYVYSSRKLGWLKIRIKTVHSFYLNPSVKSMRDRDNLKMGFRKRDEQERLHIKSHMNTNHRKQPQERWRVDIFDQSTCTRWQIVRWFVEHIIQPQRRYKK